MTQSTAPSRCDLHVHSEFSTDSGNYALRRARLGESFTPPERVYETCRERGMHFVTISDHNTVAGAMTIADRPGTFLSVEVTTRFPEDDLPLHVLVWDLTEEDHEDLQPCRESVYELVDFLHARELRHALAHPLYRMGPPITIGHVERLLLLFGVWEGRNGARPREQNELASRLAAAITPSYLAKLTERHGLAPRHGGCIALTGGSDDHAGFDLATTYTEGIGETHAAFLDAVCAGEGRPAGEHGSTVKLAHALASLGFHAYRASGGELHGLWRRALEPLFDSIATDPAARHEELATLAATASRLLGAKGREPVGLADASLLGQRLGNLLLAGGVQLPYLAAAHHHAGSRETRALETAFFGPAAAVEPARSLVFTDTFEETNGVAGTMRVLAQHGDDGLDVRVVVASDSPALQPRVIAVPPDWSLALPTYDALTLRTPLLADVLRRVEAASPDLIHVATPGPVGLSGLAAARILRLPLVGSYHTELGPYALHLTRDALVGDLLGAYVDWFYRQCDLVLAPTRAVAEGLEVRGFAGRLDVWGRGVNAEQFNPALRDERSRAELLDGGQGPLLLSVGRISHEKRLGVLCDAFALASAQLRGLRLVVIGEGPARAELEAAAPPGVRFLGELRGARLAALYASADIFCFPSTTDTFGQVLVEAGASGLAVVAAAAGGARELVGHRETGLLVAPDDSRSFAEALLELAHQPELSRALGARGRLVAEERTWARSFSELAAAYAGLLELSRCERSPARLAALTAS